MEEEGMKRNIEHVEETLKEISKAIETATNSQKNYEDEQSCNKATQLKLLQQFDNDVFTRIKKKTEPANGDRVLKSIISFLVAVINMKPTASDEEVKQAFSDFKKLKDMMQDQKLEEFTSVDEQEYLKTHDSLSLQLSQYGKDKNAQEIKELGNLILHYVVFTLTIAMAKRNIERANKQLAKMHENYINKQAEYAKKVIRTVDHEQIKLSEEAAAAYKLVLVDVFFFSFAKQ